MNIFLLTETSSGCFKWRGAIPAKYLRRRGHNVQIFANGPQSASAPDVMVFYRAHYPEATRLMEWCKKNSIRSVFDTDDALDLVPPENLNYASVQSRLELYHSLLSAADVVTTTTETLAAHLRRLNPKVVVVPNSIDPEEWTVQPRKDCVRVGWTGSPTHFADLAVALDAIRELQRKHRFLLVLQGICTEPHWRSFTTFCGPPTARSFGRPRWDVPSSISWPSCPAFATNFIPMFPWNAIRRRCVISL